VLGGGLGYGRLKPDVLAQAERVWGPTLTGGCTKHSGTSVASPVIAGVLALLASSIPADERDEVFNPASAKHILVGSATRGGTRSMVRERESVCFVSGSGSGLFHRVCQCAPTEFR
jgi:subtilisin family serine protease